jgi:hypothetical protein
MPVVLDHSSSKKDANRELGCVFRRSRTAFRAAPEQTNELEAAVHFSPPLAGLCSLFRYRLERFWWDHSIQPGSTKSVFDYVRNAVRLAPESPNSDG